MNLKNTFSRFKSVEEFRAFFADEDTVLKAIANDKWKDGFTCRKCGHDHFCDGKTPYSRRCTKCKTDESATAHTLFHHCRLNITDAFEIAFRICCAPDVSTYELSREMNTRQMTCWKFKKRVQEYVAG